MVAVPGPLPVYLRLPYRRDSYFCFQQEEKRARFVSILNDCIRHQNQGIRSTLRLSQSAILTLPLWSMIRFGDYTPRGKIFVCSIWEYLLNPFWLFLCTPTQKHAILQYRGWWEDTSSCVWQHLLLPQFTTVFLWWSWWYTNNIQNCNALFLRTCCLAVTLPLQSIMCAIIFYFITQLQKTPLSHLHASCTGWERRVNHPHRAKSNCFNIKYYCFLSSKSD